MWYNNDNEMEKDDKIRIAKSLHFKVLNSWK